MDRVPASRRWMFATIALVGFLTDWSTKNWMFNRLGLPGEQGLIEIWPGVLSLETHLNEGALFGMGQGKVPIFVAMSISAAAFVTYWLFWHGAARDRWLTIALGSVTGGIFGNLYDRIGMPGLAWNYPPERVGQRVYAVRDWIHFQVPGVFDWPVFNVADSLLVCGALMLIWQAFFHEHPETLDGPSSARRGSETAPPAPSPAGGNEQRVSAPAS